MTVRQYNHGSTSAEIAGLTPCTHCGRENGPSEPHFDERDENDDVVRTSHAVPLYFDECAAGTKDLLAEMGFCVVGSPPRSARDVDWLADAGEKGWTVITRDRRIAKREDELAAVIAHNVKCFLLPTAIRNRSDEVRAFVTMWEKIRLESLGCDGPFIWQFNAESSPVRWELVYPESLRFAAYDLSRVPIGHLLNMFAHVVTEHDQGWFSRTFVDELHNNIRSEIEARVSGDRSDVDPPSDQGVLVHEGEIGKSQQQKQQFDKPVDMGEFRLVTLNVTPVN
ncbi:MAG: hypothetical protein F4013_09075, partial [Gammaproteobacteria bacterium]|nr:hypothetical protein [Gammaproteobacteria bacterium]